MAEQSAAGSVDRMTRFERGVVFRVARGFFFLLAVAAVALFVMASITGARGLAEREIPEPPVPPEPAKLSPLSYKILTQELARETRKTEAAGSTLTIVDKAHAEGEDGAEDDDSKRLEKLTEELKALFPEPTYAWADQVERVCRSPSAWGCLDYKTRVVKQGVVGLINQALENAEHGEAVPLLETMVAVLKDAPVDKRGELIGPIVRVALARVERHLAEQAEYAVRVAAIKEEHAQEVAESKATHEQWRQQGVMGVAAGFGALVVVSLFLAFLAIERHSRTLERVLAPLAADSRARDPHV